MTGGTADPCLPAFALEQMLKNEGRQCPRVVLHEDNRIAARVALLAVAPGHAKRIVSQVSWALMSQVPYAHRPEVLSRITDALWSEDVTRAVALLKEQAVEKARG